MPRTKADVALDNMRALLASRPADQHAPLIETNIGAWQMRHLQMQAWAATANEGETNPFKGWDTWQAEEVIRGLEAMKPAPIAVAAE